MRWQPVATWDAYLRYKIGKNLTAELVGTNLGNRYYLDPINPTHMPAPGRTIRIGITGNGNDQLIIWGVKSRLNIGFQTAFYMMA